MNLIGYYTKEVVSVAKLDSLGTETKFQRLNTSLQHI